MPVGDNLQESGSLTYAGIADQYDGEDPTHILQSVKEQEAKFERLNKELDTERESLAYQLNKSRLGSDGPSMASAGVAEDSYQWQSPQSQSSRGEDGQMNSSSHLLDSCLKALEERGTMNFGYSGEQNYGYQTERGDLNRAIAEPELYPPSGFATKDYMPGNMHEGNTSFDRYSDHSPGSSRMSMESFRPGDMTRPDKVPRKIIANQELQRGGRGSLASLTRDQADDNYNPYSTARSLNSPRDSPRAPPTPTRLKNYPAPFHSISTKPCAVGAGLPRPFYGRPFLPHSNLRLRDLDYKEGHAADPMFHNPPVMEDNMQYGEAPLYPYPDNYHAPYQNSLHDNLYHDSLNNSNYRDPPIWDSYDGARVQKYSNQYRESPLDNRYRESPIEGGRYPEDQQLVDRGLVLPDNQYDSPDAARKQDPVERDGLYAVYRDLPLHNDVYYTTDPYGDFDLERRHQGLPPVRSDPFADDPFQERGRENGSYRVPLVPDQEHYRHTPSPTAGSYPYGDLQNYNDVAQQYREPELDKSFENPDLDINYTGDDPRIGYKDEVMPEHYYGNSMPLRRANNYNLGAPPDDDDDYNSDGRRTPSVDGRGSPMFRNPDLQEVIDYLSHPNDSIKADAAGYLQHLCFMDDDAKAKTRALGGIPTLIELLKHDIPEVHKNSCGALKNISYGRNNDENKKAIKNALGIPALVRLLRKTQDEEVKELVTGVLWNLSSCENLKKPIIEDSLAVLVNSVMIPHSGWGRQGTTQPRPAQGEQWTTVFRNGSGVLRNVSSSGFEARKKLRECDGLVESLIHAVKTAIGQNDIDNKPVENCVCILRNLSYRIQEVDDPEFHLKRTLQKSQKPPEKGENTGCFGGGGKKKKNSQQKSDARARPDLNLSSNRVPPKGKELLWHPDIVHIYLPLLADCSNPVTLEAAVGSIQNLAACDWQPGIDIRAAVRKEKGLAIIVELLGVESDKVVCAAATALRNLALDQRNKELVGKYAMRQLVLKLPTEGQQNERTPDDTICAVIATLYEIIKKNPDFAHSLLSEGGVSRLIHVTQSAGLYLHKTVKYAAMVLHTIWQFKELHGEYRKQGFTERDFLTKTSNFRKEESSIPPAGKFLTPTSTLNRPISGQGYDDSTLSPTRPLNKAAGGTPHGSNLDSGPVWNRNDASQDKDLYAEPGGSINEIPMIEIGYQSLDEHRERSKPPVGGVALFPSSSPNPHQTEPLYAQVNKSAKRSQVQERPPSPYGESDRLQLDGADPSGQGNADSWV